ARDRLYRAEAHRDRGELPEIGHQPGMRVRGEPTARLQLATEILEALSGKPPFEERAGVNARRRVALEVDDVAVVVVALALEEVIEADFVERRGRSIGRDVTADSVLELVGFDDHRQRVPSDEALDPPLDLAAARERRLVRRWNRVDVGGVRRERLGHTLLTRVVAE